MYNSADGNCIFLPCQLGTVLTCTSLVEESAMSTQSTLMMVWAPLTCFATRPQLVEDGLYFRRDLMAPWISIAPGKSINMVSEISLLKNFGSDWTKSTV